MIRLADRFLHLYFVAMCFLACAVTCGIYYLRDREEGLHYALGLLYLELEKCIK